MPIKVRLRCMDPATSSRSRAVPLIVRSAFRFAVISLLTSGCALRAVICKIDRNALLQYADAAAHRHRARRRRRRETLDLQRAFVADDLRGDIGQADAAPVVVDFAVLKVQRAGDLGCRNIAGDRRVDVELPGGMLAARFQEGVHQSHIDLAVDFHINLAVGGKRRPAKRGQLRRGTGIEPRVNIRGVSAQSRGDADICRRQSERSIIGRLNPQGIHGDLAQRAPWPCHADRRALR